MAGRSVSGQSPPVHELLAISGCWGSAATRWLKGDFPTADVTGKTRFDADYRLAEVGFTYNSAEPVQWGARAGVGCRVQDATHGHQGLRVGDRALVSPRPSIAAAEHDGSTGRYDAGAGDGDPGHLLKRGHRMTNRFSAPIHAITATVAAALLAGALLAGCGGGGSDSTSTGRDAPAFKVGGVFTGLLQGSVTLSNGLDRVEIATRNRIRRPPGASHRTRSAHL